MIQTERTPEFRDFIDYPEHRRKIIHEPKSRAKGNDQMLVGVTDDGFVYDVYSRMWRTVGEEGAVTFKRDGRYWQASLHILMAEAFIDNPKNKPNVIFKDPDKPKYDLSNLAWAWGREYKIGKKYGKLTVIEEHKPVRGKTIYECKCDCGGIEKVRVDNLNSGRIDCCKNCRSFSQKHGYSGTRFYAILSDVHGRCKNPNNKSYKNYGEQGITICDEWALTKTGIESFIKWAKQNGYSKNKNLSLKPGCKEFSPKNCVWLSLKEQLQNRKDKVQLLEYLGMVKPLVEWAALFGLHVSTVRGRIGSGWSTRDVFETPPGGKRK